VERRQFLNLNVDREAWADYSGEQKLAIALLRRIVRDLEAPTEGLVAEVAEWLSFTGPLGPAFCDQLLELEDGVVAAHMGRKLEEAKLALVVEEAWKDL
jgi:hypothetical protein